MKTNQEILGRLDITINELEEKLNNLKNENIKADTGMMAIQKIIDIEKLKSEINAFKEIRVYIKY